MRPEIEMPPFVKGGISRQVVGTASVSSSQVSTESNLLRDFQIVEKNYVETGLNYVFTEKLYLHVLFCEFVIALSRLINYVMSHVFT